MQAEPPPQGSGVTIRGRHIALPWLIGGVVAILLLASCACCGTIGLVGALNQPKAAATNQATSTSGITQATATPATAAATQTNQATQAPQATDTTAPASNPVVLHLKGTGDKQSSTFTVADTWTVAWTCSGGSTLYIEVYNAGDNSLDFGDSVTYDCPSGHTGSDSTVFHDSGTFYLSIIGTSQTYDITVTDMAN